jgi:hypothetical protein
MGEPIPERADAVRAALASARLEGTRISPETLAIMDRYIRGYLDGDAMMAAMLDLVGRRESR